MLYHGAGQRRHSGCAAGDQSAAPQSSIIEHADVFHKFAPVGKIDIVDSKINAYRRQPAITRLKWTHRVDDNSGVDPAELRKAQRTSVDGKRGHGIPVL